MPDTPTTSTASGATGTWQLTTRPDVTIARTHPLFRQIRYYDNAAAQAAGDLAHYAQRLAAAMTRLAGNARAAAHGEPHYTINNRGEVQNDGLRIDLTCARLAEITGFLTALLAAHAPEGAPAPDQPAHP